MSALLMLIIITERYFSNYQNVSEIRVILISFYENEVSEYNYILLLKICNVYFEIDFL